MNSHSSPWPADPLNEADQKRLNEILARYPLLRDDLERYLILSLDSLQAATKQLQFLYPEIFNEPPSNYTNPPIDIPTFSSPPDISRLRQARTEWDTVEGKRQRLLTEKRMNRSARLEREYEVVSRDCEIAKNAFGREINPIIDWMVQQRYLRENHYRQVAQEKWGSDWQTRIPKR